jgi:hypothetical protein
MTIDANFVSRNLLLDLASSASIAKITLFVKIATLIHVLLMINTLTLIANINLLFISRLKTNYRNMSNGNIILINIF